MKQIRIGVIGCGYVAMAKHLPALAANPQIAIAGVCSHDIGKARLAAERFGESFCSVYEDYNSLLSDKSIDAVHILTTNTLHAPMAIAAMEAGKHVFCEKPMAETEENAAKMLQASRRTGKLLTVNYQYRLFRENTLAKKLVAEGTLGEIYYAEANYIRQRGVPNWGSFTDMDKQGGGAVIDIGSHVLDLSMWLMDCWEPEYICARTFNKLGRGLPPALQGAVALNGSDASWDNQRFMVEDSGMAFIRMKNGSVIYLRSAWAINMPSVPGNILLCGTKGGLDTTDGLNLAKVTDGRFSTAKAEKAADSEIPGFGGDNNDAVEAMTANWVSAINGDCAPLVKAEEAYAVSKIIDGIYRSERTGKTVSFRD